VDVQITTHYFLQMRRLRFHICGYCRGLTLIGTDSDFMGIPIRLDPRPNPSGQYVIRVGRAYSVQQSHQADSPKYAPHDCTNPCPDFRSLFDNDGGGGVDADSPQF